MRLVWSKDVKDYRLKNVYVPKSYKFKDHILRNIMSEAIKPTPVVARVSY